MNNQHSSPSLFTTVREPVTAAQLGELAKSLDRLDQECHLVADLVRTIYGHEDERSSRAEEMCNALQRLHWAFERN